MQLIRQKSLHLINIRFGRFYNFFVTKRLLIKIREILYLKFRIKSYSLCGKYYNN